MNNSYKEFLYTVWHILFCTIIELFPQIYFGHMTINRWIGYSCDFFSSQIPLNDTRVLENYYGNNYVLPLYIVIWDLLYCHVWGVCVTNNNGFCIGWLNLLAFLLQLQSIITAHNQWLPRTRSIPYWTASVFSSTVTDLVLIYESVTSSTATALNDDCFRIESFSKSKLHCDWRSVNQ
jgi:hypothetical protein